MNHNWVHSLPVDFPTLASGEPPRSRMTGWLVGSLAGWLAGWLVSCLTG